jgi:hypothetical protein
VDCLQRQLRLYRLPNKTEGRYRDPIVRDLGVHYTSLPELRQHAFEHHRAAYETLPCSDTLRFETLIEEDVATLFPRKTDVVPVRLVLGYKRKARSGTKNAVYAYLCKNDHVNKGFMRLGSKPLSVQVLDDVDYEKPFDHLYDRYGMRERTMDRFGHLAAYYFLAAGHIEGLTTRSDFKVTFADLCSKIYKPTQEVTSYSEGSLLAPTNAKQICNSLQEVNVFSDSGETFLEDSTTGHTADGNVDNAATITTGYIAHSAKPNHNGNKKRHPGSAFQAVGGMPSFFKYDRLIL